MSEGSVALYEVEQLKRRVARLEDRLTRVLDVLADALVEIGMDDESLDKLNKERHS